MDEARKRLEVALDEHRLVTALDSVVAAGKDLHPQQIRPNCHAVGRDTLVDWDERVPA